MRDGRRIRHEFFDTFTIPISVVFHFVKGIERLVHFQLRQIENFSELVNVVSALPVPGCHGEDASRFAGHRVAAFWISQIIVKCEPQRDACASRSAGRGDARRIDIPLFA